MRPVHPDFRRLLRHKPPEVQALFLDLRAFVLELHPNSNELLYHTHALTTVFSISDRLGDAFCMLPIYTRHLNLGFNKGTLLRDPRRLLTGTGRLIRHIDVRTPDDYRNPDVKALLDEAIDLALRDLALRGRERRGSRPAGPRRRVFSRLHEREAQPQGVGR